MIHVVSGPPCGGKSTYVGSHAQPGDLIVDYDKIALALGAEESHGAEGIVKQAAFSARDGAIQTAVENPSAESWIIHTSLTDDQKKRYEKADAEFIKIDPGYDECMARARRDGRPERTLDAIEQYYHGKKGRHMSLYKNFKADIDDSTGEISGYFSTYDRVADLYGDVIAPGAFTETLKAREESGHPFPLCWNHSLDVDDIIGVVDSIEDDEKGPHMTAHFFDTERAQKARELVKSGAIYQFSFAYQTQDEGSVKLEDGTKANELRKLDLFEVSIVPIPANQHAVVTDIKSGRRNSKKDLETMDAIEEALKNALASLRSLRETVNDNGEPDQDGSEPEANDSAESEEQKEALMIRKGALQERIKNLHLTED